MPRRCLSAVWCVGLLAAVGACSSKPKPPAAETNLPPHEHHAPHGGTLVEMGEEFAHLEMMFDSASGRITMYVLDGEAEHAIRLPDASVAIDLDAPVNLANRPLELLAVADVLTGEKVGDSSQFSQSRRELVGLKELSGTVLAITVHGQTFNGLKFHIAGPVTDQGTRRDHLPPRAMHAFLPARDHYGWRSTLTLRLDQQYRPAPTRRHV